MEERHHGKAHKVVRVEGVLKKDLAGTVLGFTKIKKHVGFNYSNNAVFLCEDIFGEEFFCSGKAFTLSSGCNLRERVWAASSIKKIAKLRKTYYDMLARCYTDKTISSKYYQGEGVTVCDAWLGENGFHNFVLWALASGWEMSLTIDKKDKLYSPATCRWIPRGENARYTRNTVFNEEKVKQLRREYSLFDGVPNTFCKQKASEHGVSVRAIHAIVTNKRWIGV